MLDLTFTFVFVAFPVFLLLLLRAARMSLLRLDLTSFVVLFCFLFGYIGLLPLYFGWDEYRVDSGVNNRELVFYVLLGSVWSIFSLVLGSAAAGSAYRVRLTIPSNSRNVTKFFELKVVLLLVLVLLTLVDYLRRVPDIAILLAISGSVSDAESARSLMGNDFDGRYHWYSLVMHDFSSVLVFIAFAACLVRKTKANAVIFACIFCVAAFASVMAIEKGPFVWLLVGLLLVWSLNRHQGRMVVSQILPFLALGALILAVIYMIFEGSASPLDGLLAALSRAFAGSVQPAYHYLEIFPAHHEFLYGRSFPNPGGLLPWEPYRLTEEVMNWVTGSDGTIVRSAPTIFWAELYANFGVLGVLFLPMLLGFYLVTIQALIVKLPDGPVKVGYYAWVLLHFKDLAVSSFSMFLIDIYLFGVTMVALMMVFRLKWLPLGINKSR